MSLIIGENITHSFGSEEVLRNVSFRISPSDRIGIVGPNGEGKTTLLRIIGGSLESTLGEIHRSRGLSVGYLPQTPPSFDGGTVYEVMLGVFSDLRRMERELHEYSESLVKDDEDSLKRYGQMQAEFENLGGFEYVRKIDQVLTGLGFERPIWDRPVSQLSGGQRTRVYLASLLLQNPDVLLLDEPTNHLDLETVEWLEYWLSTFGGAILAVSHDRYFLNRITTNTWEIAFGTIETFKGAYSEYLKQRHERHEQRMRQWESQEEYIAKTRDFIARHLAGQRTKEAQGRRTRLERFLRDEAIDRPREHRTIHVNLFAAERSGEIVVRAENLAVGYKADSPILKTDRLEIIRLQRIAVVGANGTGKTTLVRTLLGDLKPLAGVVMPGANMKVGYLSQTHSELDPESKVIDSVMEVKLDCKEQQARAVLGSLLLNQEDVLKQIKHISGGQRSRVALARLMMQKINVLVLDEPTNHLDVPSTEIMQEVLKDFDGTIIFVTHDRYLVQAVATHVWAIHDGQVRCITGGWEDFLLWRDAFKQSVAPVGKDDGKADYRQSRKDSNALNRLKKRHEEIEKQIQSIEAELLKLNDAISTASQTGNLVQVEKFALEYQQKNEKLQELWQQWELVGEQIEEMMR